MSTLNYWNGSLRVDDNYGRGEVPAPDEAHFCRLAEKVCIGQARALPIYRVGLTASANLKLEL